MDNPIYFNKREGETPLQAIDRLRQEFPDLSDEKITYAGRLDPMASGIIPMLWGNKTKDKEKYTKLPKTYEFEILFGVETDTLDILGLVKKKQIYDVLYPNIQLMTAVDSVKGSHNWNYPDFSSKTIDGKQMHELARSGELENTKKPSTKMVVNDIQIKRVFTLKSDQLEALINQRVSLVKGDFRQKETLETWKKLFTSHKQNSWFLARIEANVESGTYIRTLCQKIGEEVGIPAIAWKINRINIGEKKGEEKLWFKRKFYGWGWYPASAEGWGVTAIYALAIWWATLVAKLNTLTPNPKVFFLLLAVFSAGLIYTAYKKGEKPRWQWGGE